MSKLIAFLIIIALSGCGGSGSSAPNSQTVADPGNPGQVSYSLIATKESDGSSVPASLQVTQAVTVTMPSTLSYVANAASNNYVVLTLGSYYCDYENTGTTIYERLDGTCNGTPNAPIHLNTGDTLSLYLSSNPSAHTAVEAIIEGVL